MDPLGVLLGVLLGAIVAMLVVRHFVSNDDPAEDPQPRRNSTDRLAELCASLNGDPRRDRPILNRILALGPEVVPLLLDQLHGTVKSNESVKPELQARIEELVADFGLAASPSLRQHLTRTRPGSPQGAGLMRILVRLGHAGGIDLLRRAFDTPGLLPFVPRLRLASEPFEAPDEVLHEVLGHRPIERLRRDLDTVAGLIVNHPVVVDRLWAGGDARTRAAVLEWLCNWLPLARLEHVEAGLADEEVCVRIAAAHLGALLVDPTLVGPLGDLTRDGNPSARAAAAHALGTQPLRGAVTPLRATVNDPDPEVAVAAALALWRHRDAGLSRAVASSNILADSRRGALLRAAFPLEGALRDIDPLLAALSDPDAAVRQLSTRLLGAFVDVDPRARERLIRAAEGADRGDRVAAVTALVLAGDETAPEQLAAALIGPVDPDAHLWLQEAAQCLGDKAVMPIARKVANGHREHAGALLSVLRVQPFLPAIPVLLRALEKTRGEPIEAAIAATLQAGSAEVRSAVDDCLEQPRRGLLVPALTYLAAYGTPDDLPILIALYDRHPPLRGILLNLIEAQGPAAVDALGVRVRRGGDEGVVAALERRLAVLVACTPAR